MRKAENCRVLIAVNRWNEPICVNVPEEFNNAEALWGNTPENSKLTISPEDFAILTI